LNRYYDELTVSVKSSPVEALVGLLSAICDEAIEIGDREVVVRSEESLSGLAKEIEKLNDGLSNPLDITMKLEKRENEDWIEKYKKSIEPIEAGLFHIRPQWHEASSEKIDILVNPALAFGSGHHATTYSCLEAIGDVVTGGERVLDVGCGSGILAIAARKLGAVVELCDTDPLAVDSATENFSLNDESFEKIWVGSANGASGSYDVVIANIIADVLRAISGELKRRVSDGGKLILSGILDKKESIVTDSFKDMKLLERKQKDEWVTLVYEKDVNGG